MSGDRKGGAQAPPITGEEVQAWFREFSEPHPSAEDCAALANLMTALAWPEPIEWPPLPDGRELLPFTPWDFDGVPKAAQILLANLPIMLSPWSVPAIPPGDVEGRAALTELQAALNRAAPYLGTFRGRSNNKGYRPKAWHNHATIVGFTIFSTLVRVGIRRPGIAGNSIVAGVLRSALVRMGHEGHGGLPLTKTAIGIHLTRRLAASGQTTSDVAAEVRRRFAASGMTTNNQTAFVTKT